MYGLVAWSSLGRIIGVATPTIDAVSHLIGTLNQTDYFALGERSLDRFGLSALNVEQLNQFLDTGVLPHHDS
jgi:opine dehydrogenase